MQNYYFLGAVWKGFDIEDQAPRFLKDGIWESAHDDNFIDVVNSVEVGARVAIKSTFTDGPGHKNSVTRIKGIGTVIENPQDGKILKINWDSDFEEFDFDGGGCFSTISIVRKKENIIKAFFHGRQYVESRVSRLAWNTKSWVEPSGQEGKSDYSETHEKQFGYGHEEWLLDTGKLIDGYHYGFLEPIRKQQAAFSNKTYNVWLYSIDGVSGIRYWVGEINNLEVLDEEESKAAYEFYKKQGWLEEMENQLRTISSTAADKFSKDNYFIFNVKFRPTDLVFNDPLVELPVDHPIAKQTRYVFANFSNDFIVNNGFPDNTKFIEPPRFPQNNEPLLTKQYTRKEKSIEITYLHNIISDKLVRYLQNHGEKNVNPEYSGFTGGRIDIMVRNNDGLIFYEIKTYNSIKASIREAIGQLMEYAFWPNVQNAKELIIVTPPSGELEDTKKYLKHIRDTYHLPIFYQAYDLEKETLSEKY